MSDFLLSIDVDAMTLWMAVCLGLFALACIGVDWLVRLCRWWADR